MNALQKTRRFIIDQTGDCRTLSYSQIALYLGALLLVAGSLSRARKATTGWRLTGGRRRAREDASAGCWLPDRDTTAIMKVSARSRRNQHVDKPHDPDHRRDGQAGRRTHSRARRQRPQPARDDAQAGQRLRQSAVDSGCRGRGRRCIPIDEVRKSGEDFAIMLEWFDRVGYDADIRALAKEFGFTPLTLAEWAARHSTRA